MVTTSTKHNWQVSNLARERVAKKTLYCPLIGYPIVKRIQLTKLSTIKILSKLISLFEIYLSKIASKLKQAKANDTANLVRILKPRYFKTT